MKKLFSVKDLDAALFHLLFGTYTSRKKVEKFKMFDKTILQKDVYDELLKGEMFESDVRPCVDLLEFYLTFDGEQHLLAADYVLKLFSKRSRMEVFSRLSEKNCLVISTRSEELKKFMSDFDKEISEKRAANAKLRSMSGGYSEKIIKAASPVRVLKLGWWKPWKHLNIFEGKKMAA